MARNRDPFMSALRRLRARAVGAAFTPGRPIVILDEAQNTTIEQMKMFLTRLGFGSTAVVTGDMTQTDLPRHVKSGLRDLSIIATPPANRLAVQTFVTPWDGALLREAFQRELARGGQLYFLHNDVESIGRMRRELEEMVPEARIGIAHGQMPERELEQVMLDFHRQRTNVLLASTIIESGIDIPNANTIIINRADKFGLAQLHQLRGRVGRSHHRAYAYLVIPDRRSITEDARKRLDAIASMDELGAGFTLATHDLEIRGAGELLGEEQSGQMAEVGFSLYTELLERAVTSIKQGKLPDVDAAGDLECYTTRSLALHEWRKFLFTDPGLPLEVLPPDWPGSRASKQFRDVAACLRPGAAGYVDTCIRTALGRSTTDPTDGPNTEPNTEEIR